MSDTPIHSLIERIRKAEKELSVIAFELQGIVDPDGAAHHPTARTPYTAEELHRLAEHLPFSVAARAAIRAGTPVEIVTAVGRQHGLTRQGIHRALNAANYQRKK